MVSNTSLAQAIKDGIVVVEDCELSEAQATLGRAKKMLADLTNPKNSLSVETRFALAYDASHGFLQTALRMAGYRTTQAPGHRAVLFDLIPTLTPGAEASRDPLVYAHGLRNRLEYDTVFDVPNSVVEDMVTHVKSVAEEVEHAFRKFKRAKEPAVPAPSPSASPSPSAPTARPANKKRR